MLASSRAKFAIPMRRNFNSNGRRPQMCHVAKEVHGIFPIPVFQFPIGRTHPAHRLNLALKALRNPRALSRAQLQERSFPDAPYSSLANAEGLLLRDHADSHLPVSIDGESIHPSAAEVHAM